MISLFTSHPRSKGLGYIEHAKFAAAIGIKLLISGAYFLVHALFPFIPIKASYNLKAMSLFLHKENEKVD